MAADKVESSVTEAMGRKEMAYDVGSATHCPECGREIGESDPRQGYVKNGVVVVGHSSCADRVLYQPKTSTVAMKPEDVPAVLPPFRGKRISFATFSDLQNFIVSRGVFAPDVEICIGDIVVQEGS